MKFNKKTLSLTIACLLGTAALNANATIIDLNISGETITNVATDSTSDTDSSATNMSAFSSASNDTSFSNANARGDDTGWFYSTASANGMSADAQSTVTQTYTVTNDSADDQFFDFSFDVNQGSINANCNDGYGDDGYGDDGYGEYGFAEAAVEIVNGCSGNDFAAAGYMAEILVDGASLWESQAEVTDSVNGGSFTSSGAMFDTFFLPSPTDSDFSWSATSFNLDLGLIAAGETFVLEYVVSTKSTSSSDSFNSQTKGDSQFGDPNGFATSNVSFTSQSASVPVPASLGLLGLGLAGFGLSRRKNKAKN